MAWRSIPNFGDKFARVSQREHVSGTIVEVLYGARDANGNPTDPVDRNRDGHGHWIAVEIDGAYQMVSWRHPAYEGGAQEYGKNGSENALFDLEMDMAAKERICNEAESLAQSHDWKNASRRFRELFDEWKGVYNWRTPKEKAQWERFKRAREVFYGRRETEWAKNKTTKQGIVSEARNLAYSNDWKMAGNRFKELMEGWKAAGFAGKEDDDALWDEFNGARQAFYDRREKHFREQDEKRARNRSAKQALIAEARSVAQYSEDWKATGDALRGLMDRWRGIGSAGREYDDELWGEFNGIRQGFFERRRLYYEERDREYQARAARKSAIVQEAAAIAARCDYSAEATERMKELDRIWKDVGFSGRDNEDSLWSLFRDAKDSFWMGKRAYAEERQREWREKLNDAIWRKRDQISNLQNQIYELESKMAGMTNQEYIDNMCRWIDEKEARIRELEMAISDMERKL